MNGEDHINNHKNWEGPIKTKWYIHINKKQGKECGTKQKSKK